MTGHLGGDSYTRLRFMHMMMNYRNQNVQDGCWLIAAAFFFVLNFSAIAAPSTPTDKRTKIIIAGMVSGFLSYIKWPETDDNTARYESFKVGVLGEDEVFFKAMARYLAQKSHKDKRRFEVVKASMETLSCCQVLVVIGDVEVNTKDIVASIAHLPILTISDQADFAATGGHINFFYQRSKLRFEVNWQAARTSKLKMSSRLLNLARVINKP